MGSEKQTTSGSTSSTYTKSPEELEQYKQSNAIGAAAMPGQIAANEAGLSAVTKLLTGQALPGYLEQLPGGINEERIASMNKYSLRDLNNQLAASGTGSFMESGAAQQAGVRAAMDTRNQAAQYNLNNLMQLLNIGVGGQASVQQPISTYSGQLAGLVRGTGSTTGTSTSTVTSMNPFLKSLQQGAGTSLGGGNFGSWTF
jgi:hypothetical protein